MSDFPKNDNLSDNEKISPQNISPETEIKPENLAGAEPIILPAPTDADNIAPKAPDISTTPEQAAGTYEAEAGVASGKTAVDDSLPQNTAAATQSENVQTDTENNPGQCESNQSENSCNCCSDTAKSTEGNSAYAPYSPVNAAETNSRRSRKQLTPAGICALCICTTLIFNIIAFALTFTFFIKPSAQKDQKYLSPTPNNSESGNSSINSVINASNPSAIFNPSEVYADNVNSVVGISSDETIYNIFGQASTYASTGTGFIISEDGYILTNYHVVQSSGDITVTLYNGSSYTASLVGYESSSDVAVLKIDATDLQAVKVGDNSDIVVGENICVIGNPLGELTYTLTQGGISALQREINVDGQPISMFQFDAAVSPGNSGGPVFNANGEVIGIVTAKSIQSGVEGIGFAIPISDVKTIVNDLIENGYVTGKAYFGIGVQNSGYPKGAYVMSVNPGSCAEKAGIEVGDILTEIDGKQVTTASELISAKRSYRAGDTVTVRGYRNGEGIVFTVTFDEETPELVSQNNNSLQQRQQQQQQSQNEYYYYNDGMNPYYYYYR